MAPLCFVGLPVGVLAGAIVVVAGAGCGGNAFSTGSGPGDASTVGDSGPRGGDASADADASSGEGGDDGGDDAATGKVIYVSSSTGDDTRSGLDPSKPVKTIVEGLARATSNGATSVEVCGGNYPESDLVVGREIQLLGGYDCVHWTRPADYGFPTFAQTDQAVITNADPNGQAATIVVLGAGITPATVIDGFTVTGTSMRAGETYGIDVQGGASPTIQNDVLSGGAGSSPTGAWGSVGIRIGGTSSSELAHCLVSGGSGEGAIGSVGVIDQSTGAPNVHDDVVSGGTGVSSGTMPNVAAVGIAVLASLGPNNPLASDIVSGADTKGISGTSVGVLVSGPGVAAGIVGCEVEGGKGTDAMTTSIGVELETTGAVGLVSDRIFGGTRTGTGSNTIGVHSGEAAAVTVANSEIHAGTASGGSSSTASGIVIAAGTAPSIVFDTIYAGAAAGGVAIQLGGAASSSTSVSGAVITDDLLVGGGTSANGVAIVLPQCTGVVGTLDHDAFANFPLLGQCPGTGKVVFSPSMFSTVVGTGVSTTGDIEFQTACSGATGGCVSSTACPSTDAATCASSLFGTSWSADNDDGVAELFAGPPGADGGATLGGWQIAAGSPCALTRGGTSISAYPKDLFGTAHGSTPTMGAAEYDAAMACQ